MKSPKRVFANSLLINAKVSIVFEYLSNPVYKSLWQNDFVSSTLEYDKLISGQISSAFFEETIKDRNITTYKWELLQFHPGEEFGIKRSSFFYDFELNYELVEKTGTTLINFEIIVFPKLILYPMYNAIFLQSLVNKYVQQLVELKLCLEKIYNNSLW